jgi:hypothetical protein
MGPTGPDLIGVCGDCCEACPRFLATVGDDPSGLERAKDLWVRLGLRTPDFPAEKLGCRGCGPTNDCAYPELRACAYARSVANCGLCPEYPCGLVDAAFANSERLRPRVQAACDPRESAALETAFLAKKRRLDAIHAAIALQSRPAQGR